jgi:hypothetical protein
MLGFVDDAVILLCRSPGSDIKTICFDILAHLFTVVCILLVFLVLVGLISKLFGLIY